MSRSAVAEAAEALNERFDLPETYDNAVPLSALIETGHNARHRFDPTKLGELAASIREKGIIEPLVVRPFALNGETKYEIVAGARRFRAAKIAGRTHVPCVIRKYADSDVLELQIIENIQRENLEPLEEAAGFHTLIESNKAKYSVAYIADRIGRSEGYVWDTLRLLGLSDDAKELLANERITRTHAVVLAKLTKKQQDRIINPQGGGLWSPEGRTLDLGADPLPHYSGLKACSVRELEAHIATHVRFNPKLAAELAPMEFGDVVQRIETANAKPGRGKKVISITYETYVSPDAKEDLGDERIYGPSTWKRADDVLGGGCDHSVLGVVAVGDGYGQAFPVCTAKDKCDVHWSLERKEKEKTQKLRDSGQNEKATAREEKKQQERAAEEQKRAEAKALWQAAQPVIIDQLVLALKKARPGQLAALVVDGCDRTYNRSNAKLSTTRIKANNRAEDIVRQAALCVLLSEISIYDAQTVFPKRVKFLGVDVAKILRDVAKQKAKEVKS